MFKHLLVPLDGSPLAEAALPIASCLADKLGALVTLVHVIERDAPEAIHGERHLTAADEAHAYLDEVARRSFPAGVQVESHVHSSEVADVARSIVEHQGELAPDLIIMSIHGHGGLRDIFLGNIAQQVVARGTTPVLLVHATDTSGVNPFRCPRLLVPLDGTSAHEQGLSVAMDLARSCGAEIHLLLVVPTRSTLPAEKGITGRLLPGATAAVLELAQQEAASYLQSHMARIQAQGLTVTAQIGRGDPTTVIVEVAGQSETDLIVFGTHGRSGMEAFWSGSVAPQVSQRSHLPVLLVPLPESG